MKISLSGWLLTRIKNPILSKVNGKGEKTMTIVFVSMDKDEFYFDKKDRRLPRFFRLVYHLKTVEEVKKILTDLEFVEIKGML